MSIEINGAGVITGVDSLSTPAVINTAGSASAPSITFTEDTNTGIYSPGADQVAISTGGAGRLFVDASGNIYQSGSSADPFSRFDDRQFAINASSAAQNAALSINAGSTAGRGGQVYLGQGGTRHLTLAGNNSESTVGTASNTPLRFETNATERLRITSAGLVGVGTSSPSNTAGFGQQVEIAGTLPCLTLNQNNAGFTTRKYSLAVNASGDFGIWDNTASTYRMYIDSSGRVGVGTTSPSGRLTIENDAALNELEFTGSNYTNVYSASTLGFDIGISNGSSTGPLRLLTANAERLRIDSSGRVGIGTSSPVAALTVVGSAGAGDAGIQITSGSSNVGSKAALFFVPSTSPSFSTGSAIKSERLSPDGCDLQFFTVSSLGNTPVRAMTIDSSQRVGIGTTSAGGILHTLTTGSDNVNFFERASGAKFGIYNSSVNSYIGTFSNHDLRLATNDTERARIDTSGRLLVGTSSASSGAPSGGALIQGSGSAAGPLTLQVDATPASAGTDIGLVRFTNSAGGLGAQIKCVSDGSWTNGSNHRSRLEFSTTADGASSPTERMRIDNGGTAFFTSISNVVGLTTTQAAGTTIALLFGKHSGTAGVPNSGTLSFSVASNGNVQNTNGSYTAISDAKLKENVSDASSQWEDLKAIQIRNWNFKAETGHETHRQIGPIAQELETVCPGLVFAMPDRDEDGNETGEVTKGVNQSVLYMKAVKALQEAMERIEALEQRLNDAGIN